MPLISRSTGRKLLATLVAIVGFVFVYETTVRDSRYAARSAIMRDATAVPLPGARLQFSATAYCKGTTTASGVNVRTGIAAADPALLPVGSVVTITTDNRKYNGIYTIMDTGPKVQGRTLDLYMWSCNEALTFGRKPVEVTVLRLGWNPRASGPGLIDTLFRRREAAREAQPSAAPAAPPAAPPPAAAPAAAPPAAEPAAGGPSEGTAADPGAALTKPPR